MNFESQPNYNNQIHPQEQDEYSNLNQHPNYVAVIADHTSEFRNSSTKSRSKEKQSIPSTSNRFFSMSQNLLVLNRVLNLAHNRKDNGVIMFRKEVIRYFKLHLNMCSRIGSIGFCWDKENNEFGIQKNKVKRFQFYCHITIAIVHNLFMLWALSHLDIGRFRVSYKMLSIYFTTGYCLCNGLRLFAWLHEKNIIILMNSNFTLEQDIRVGKEGEKPDGVLRGLLRNSAKSQRALLILGLITGLSVPTLVFLILLANPCQPPFIGSIVFAYTDDHKCVVTSWTLHFLISVANFWMHLDMVLPMVFTMFGLFFLSVSFLHDYIEFIKRKISTNCATERRWETLLVYRKIQILEKQLNACFRQQYFPLVLSGMTALLIFCLYSCIRLHDKIPMPGFSYFPIVALDGIVSILVMNTKAANVLEHSMGLVKMFRNDPKFKRSHWAKKMSWSLTPLKINFMMNFVDKSTPLIFINFSLNQVVSLLLVGSERSKNVQIEDVISN